MLPSREAFKVGFLARCASLGLSEPEILRTVKGATDKLALFGEALGLAKNMAGGVIGYGVPFALAAPPIVGGLTGYGLARATDISDTDVADVKDQEVLDAYRRNTEQLKRQRAIRDYQKLRRTTGRIL